MPEGKDRYRPTREPENIIIVDGGGYTGGSGVTVTDDSGTTTASDDGVVGVDDSQDKDLSSPTNLKIDGTRFVFSEDRRHLVDVFLSWDEQPNARYYEVRLAAI